MPRGPRKLSNSGVYHIMLRGTNKQRIFHDDRDYQTFLEGLRKYRNQSNFALMAYCFMPNHLHLLLRADAGSEPIGKIMRRLGTWYVYRYNRRYERSGPLFEGRYKSEAVEDDAYFLTALRYIHRNPVKAGMVSSPVLYPYSSCAFYLSAQADDLVDTSRLLSLMRKEELADWHEQDESAGCLDLDERPGQKRIADDKALQVMQKASGAGNLEEFGHLGAERRAAAVRRMRKAGASLPQIVRITGISMALVRKVLDRP